MLKVFCVIFIILFILLVNDNKFKKKEKLEGLKNLENFCKTIVDSINPSTYKPNKIDPVINPVEDPNFNKIDYGKKYFNDFTKKSNKVTFDPLVKNIDAKYQLYGDNLFTFHPAGTIDKETNIMSNKNKAKTHLTGRQAVITGPEIDQKVNLNIMNYVNNPINSNKTIKDIYDELTNDNRLVTTKDIDNLEAFTKKDDFILGEKYGATRFDTYSIIQNLDDNLGDKRFW